MVHPQRGKQKVSGKKVLGKKHGIETKLLRIQNFLEVQEF